MSTKGWNLRCSGEMRKCGTTSSSPGQVLATHQVKLSHSTRLHIRDDRPALPRKMSVLPRPEKIDKIRGAKFCTVDSDMRT